jgi:hypothetical protein
MKILKRFEKIATTTVITSRPNIFLRIIEFISKDKSRTKPNKKCIILDRA